MINLANYFEGVQELVSLDDLKNQWKSFMVLREDINKPLYHYLIDFDIHNKFKTPQKTILLNACNFFADIQQSHNRELLNWFIRLDIELSNFLILRLVFMESGTDPLHATILATFIDLNWNEEVDFILKLGLFDLSELSVIFYMTYERQSNYLFDKLVTQEFINTAPEIILKLCYHYFCIIGYWDHWLKLYQCKRDDWWTIEECISELSDSNISSWDFNDMLLSCVIDTEKQIRFLQDRERFKLRAVQMNKSLTNVLETTLEKYITEDGLIYEINNFFWGTYYDEEIRDNMSTQKDEYNYLRMTKKFSCLKKNKKETSKNFIKNKKQKL